MALSFFFSYKKIGENYMDLSIIIVIILGIFYHINSRQIISFSHLEKKVYLASKRWQEKRQKILKRDDHICQGCETKNRLEIHHISYRKLGYEPLEDLITLCRDCHQKQHDFYGYNYETFFFPIIK